MTSKVMTSTNKADGPKKILKYFELWQVKEQTYAWFLLNMPKLIINRKFWPDPGHGSGSSPIKVLNTNQKRNYFTSTFSVLGKPWKKLQNF
jgi:hypothetical protein